MAEYRHGVYVQEQGTSLTAPVEGSSGLQVIVGTAPVNVLKNPEEAVNVPKLVHSYAEAVAAVGYHPDFAKYTLCEAISANFTVLNTAPIILINVLDPAKHSATLQETDVDVTDGVAVLSELGVLLQDLKVKNGATELEQDVDYTTAFQEDGTLQIVLIRGGAGDGATKLTVSGKKLDPELVTAADVVGGVDLETGAETGLEVIRQIYPKFALTPGILLAPRFSKEAAVSAALQAKTMEINGVFRAVCVVDLDTSRENGATTYSKVKSQKEGQSVTSPNAYAVWPCAKVGDVVYSGSTLAAALTAYNDTQHSNIPNWSPSNQPLSISAACLEDGTEILLDQEQANTVNSFGVATWLNMNGFRLWGNNTACYPSVTAPKDRWFSVRRFMSWAANTFILTYFQKVDNPMNAQLIEAIVDSENIRGNSFVSRGICARYEITYHESENPVTDLMNGKMTFHQYITPFTPAEHIENVIEFDPYALSSALGGAT